MSDKQPDENIGGVKVQATAPCSSNPEKEVEMSCLTDGDYLDIVIDGDGSKSSVKISKNHFLEIITTIFPGINFGPSATSMPAPILTLLRKVAGGNVVIHDPECPNNHDDDEEDGD